MMISFRFKIREIILLSLLAGGALLSGCFALRTPSGGGQTTFKPPRMIRPGDIALLPGYRIEPAAAGLIFPTGVTFDDQGRIYIVESGYSYGEAWATPRLLRIDPGKEPMTIAAGSPKNGPWNGVTFFWLLVATVGLYGGGIVFNDFFDAKRDASERPERPIPRGAVSIGHAALLGGSLLVLGVAAGFQAGPVSGLLAGAIALLALLYDVWGKTEPILGTVGIGLCRGLNLLLGMSAAPAFLALIPFFYITAVTLLSKGEVRGSPPGRGAIALFLLLLSIGIFLLPAARPPLGIGPFLPLWFLLLIRVVPPFWRAARRPEPAVLRGGVEAGILSLILLDATLAAGHAGLIYGLALLSLSLLAGPLARRFAVT